MRIQVTDEPTRQALSRALWRMMGHPVEEALLDSLIWSCGDVDADEAEMEATRVEVDARLAAISGFRHGIDEISEAQEGDSVDLAVEPACLAYELKNLRDGVSDAEERFFNAVPAVRQRMLALYDAAGVLMSKLPEPDRSGESCWTAEAVA